MDYVSANTAVLSAITALGERGLAIFLAALILAGSVFLIRWGFRVGKNALNGDLSSTEPTMIQLGGMYKNAPKFKDEMEFEAWTTGYFKNRRDNINLYD